MYARRRYATKRATVSYRRSRIGSGTTTKMAYKRRPRYTNKLRFATVAFSRNIERKYVDWTWKGNTEAKMTSTVAPSEAMGVTFTGSTWNDYRFGNASYPDGSGGYEGAVNHNLVKAPDSGTTATTRIGNRVKVKYVKGAMTFIAATVGDGTILPPLQGGETMGTNATALEPYIRTTIRMVIVKDTQVNNATQKVTWNDVFENNMVGGVHAELKIENMGRFFILEDKTFTIDADDPQKTCQFTIPGSKIGGIRYNGGDSTALADKGFYIVWAGFVGGYKSALTLANIKQPQAVGHSRMCFTDD